MKNNMPIINRSSLARSGPPGARSSMVSPVGQLPATNQMPQTPRLVQFVAQDKPQPGQESPQFPAPQFWPAGEGIPISELDVVLFAPGLPPDMEAPAAEGPIPGVLKKPQPIQQSVAIEGHGVGPPFRLSPDGIKEHGPVNQECMGK